MSTVKSRQADVPAGGNPEATALNAPSTKWTLGATAKDIGPLTAGLTFRNVNAYYFRSGINAGVIPTFGTLDANVSLKVPTMQNAMRQPRREQPVRLQRARPALQVRPPRRPACWRTRSIATRGPRLRLRAASTPR